MNTELVRRYIEKNAGRITGVQPLAAELDMPVDALRKQFRRTEGIPISKFITLRKVEHAKRLLAETDKYCFEICFESGFLRGDDGSRTFKRVTGMTMEEYRESEKEKERGCGIGAIESGDTSL